MYKFESSINQFAINVSVSALSDVYQVKKFVWTFILPNLCLIGLLTNSINVVVFSQRSKLKNSIYRYFQWHSMVDIVYLTICLVRLIINLEAFKSVHCLYWTKIFEAYVYRYVTASLAMFMIFIELIIAAKRLLMIMNITMTVKLKFETVIAGCALMAFASLSPLAASLRVVSAQTRRLTIEVETCTGSAQVYILTQDNVPHFEILKRLYMSVLVFRGLIAPLLLLLLNIGIAARFRKLCKNKTGLMTSQPSKVTSTCSEYSDI